MISDLLGRQKSEQGKIKLDLIPGLYLPVHESKADPYENQISNDLSCE